MRFAALLLAALLAFQVTPGIFRITVQAADRPNVILIQAPMLAKFQGRTEAVASSLDLPVSIARWAGAKVPAGWTGRDLTTALRSKRDHKLPHAVVEFADNQSKEFGQYAYRAIRTPTTKLILWEAPTKRDELYDLVKDPRETANLIDDPALDKTKADLRAQLDAWMKRTADRFRAKSGDAAISR